MSNHQVKCAVCNVEVQGPSDPQPDSHFGCPSCGNGDTYENILSEVQQQVVDKTKMSLNRMFDDAVRGSSFMKVTSHYRPSGKHYRFIVDFNP